MIALDGEHGSWFFLEITEEEASLFSKTGRTYLDDLAQRIRSSAPGVRGNKSPFTARSLVMTPARKRADAAVDAWYADKQT
ncbi:hypothetical protein [Variovorax guangxiensis]|nr:hypothetical protein [Variovorax guangxiensis]